ncbi:MAG: helix-turn-helix domain-containing protein, partial [Pseudomonadota bacterium]
MSDTRNQILDAAEQQFADRGFYGVSLANIAETLGVTKQALLHLLSIQRIQKVFRYAIENRS